MNTLSQQWQEIVNTVNRKIIEYYPDYILISMSDKASGNELDQRYEEIREELELYQEFDNS